MDPAKARDPREVRDDRAIRSRALLSDDAAATGAFAALRLARSLTQVAEAGAANLGLTHTQVAILMIAASAGDRSGNVTDFAKVLGISHAGVIRATQPLIDKGLIAREAGDDRRSTILLPTQAAIDWAEGPGLEWLDRIRRPFELRDPDDVWNFVNVAESAVSVYSADQAVAASMGSCNRCVHASPDVSGDRVPPCPDATREDFDGATLRLCQKFEPVSSAT